MVAGLFPLAVRSADAQERPNIIFILADDMGYHDTSYNGQTHFSTPNLDRMAREGLIFTNHYSGSTVCAPSRAALLTGNHTGRVYQRGNKTLEGGEIEFRRDPHDITIARRLKDSGYQTALIGKSGIACNSADATLPNDKGFDHFFGFLAHRNAHRFYPRELTRNGETVTYPNNHERHGDTYSGDAILGEVLDYLDERKEGAEPFFLHVALQQPHSDLAVPEQFRAPFVGKFEETPLKGGGYTAQSHPKATYAGMMTYLDDSVGQILQKLRGLGLAGKTLVLFSADNGSHSEGGYHYGMFDSNHPFRGGKRDLFEGGIHVPMLAWWPGTVEGGGSTDHISAFWDFAPTALELAGETVPAEMDGISYLPTLRGDAEEQRAHEYLYWEFHEMGGRQAVRWGDWKGVRLNVHRNREAPIQLFNLAVDPGEADNVARAHPEVVERIAAFMTEAHEPSEHFRF